MDQVPIFLVNVATNKLVDMLIVSVQTQRWLALILALATLHLVWSLFISPNDEKLRSHWSFWL